MGFSITFIIKFLFSILTMTSEKNPDLYNFLRIILIEFSFKNFSSGRSEKTKIVSFEIR